MQRVPLPDAHDLRPWYADVAELTKTYRRPTMPLQPLYQTDLGKAFHADSLKLLPTLIECGNNKSNSRYIRESKRLGQKVHPARFPAELPRFFMQFLTEPGDLVLDPFAGSNTTGAVAEELGRRWLAIERNEKYAQESELRFNQPQHSARTGTERLLFDLSS